MLKNATKNISQDRRFGDLETRNLHYTKKYCKSLSTDVQTYKCTPPNYVYVGLYFAAEIIISTNFLIGIDLQAFSVGVAKTIVFWLITQCGIIS